MPASSRTLYRGPTPLRPRSTCPVCCPASSAARPVRPCALRSAFLEDPALLGRLLSELAALLPFAPILIVDQAEEVFTLARSKQDEKARIAVLEMLRQLNSARGGFKVIVSIRTEYLGRMVDRLRLGARDIRGVREYLLTDFNAEFLARAIRHPTSREPIPYSAVPPFEKYQFSYADSYPTQSPRGCSSYGRPARIAYCHFCR